MLQRGMAPWEVGVVSLIIYAVKGWRWTRGILAATRRVAKWYHLVLMAGAWLSRHPKSLHLLLSNLMSKKGGRNETTGGKPQLFGGGGAEVGHSRGFTAESETGTQWMLSIKGSLCFRGFWSVRVKTVKRRWLKEVLFVFGEKMTWKVQGELPYPGKK